MGSVLSTVEMYSLFLQVPRIDGFAKQAFRAKVNLLIGMIGMRMNGCLGSSFDFAAIVEKALDIVESIRPDMLISDVIMQGITGIDTAIAVRAILPRCRILLFSGQPCTANLLERAPAQRYEFELLNRPVHPSDLLARMRAAATDHPGVHNGLAIPDRRVKLFS
jgi:CheY-like chemotaxis protein